MKIDSFERIAVSADYTTEHSQLIVNSLHNNVYPVYKKTQTISV